MAYQLTKELMKFIFSIFVLYSLVIGLVVISFLQVSRTIDVDDVEMYNVYSITKDCKECVQNYCVNKVGKTCEIVKKCKTFGYIDKIEVCL